jgi:hypothetical protein
MRLMSPAALLLAATLVAAPEAKAQMSFSVAAGATVPVGDEAEVLSMGYHATVGLGIKPMLAPVGVRIEGMFNSLAYKDDTPVLGGESLRVLALTANATLSGPMIPMGYLIAGVGMYNTKVSVDGADANSDFGFNFGGGINLPLTGFSTFAEVRYHHVPVEGGAFKFVPISVGIRF